MPADRETPSLWLKEALEHASAATDDKGLYFNLSFMPQLAQSSAEAEAWKYETTMLGRLLGDFTDSNNGKYAKAFTVFLADPANAVLGRRLIYGTDLHMPGVSTIGLGDQYERLIEGVLQRATQGPVSWAAMPSTSSGCGQGGRIVTGSKPFYKANGIDTGKVRWMQRLKHLEIDT